MLDIASLERRWLKYKIKRYFPFMLLSIAAVAIGIVSLFMVSAPTAKSPVPLPVQTPHLKQQSSLPPKTASESETTVLEPSMQFMQTFGTSSIPDTEITSAPSQPIPPKAPKQNPSPKTVSTAVAPISPPPLHTLVSVQQEPKSKLSTLKRDNATLDIHEVERRFHEGSNPNLGLFIARYHYDHGNYTEAYNYALRTNAINSSMDESWLIFAKSLVKLGKIDQAKKTLQLYISNSNSESAKNLLNTLNKEKNQ